MNQAEILVQQSVQWLRLAVETTGAVIVGLGFLIGLAQFVQAGLLRRPVNFTALRLVLARYLALALEFQLGADILSTAIAPSWNQIGKLGAIAVIRTGLNYFLSQEIREERTRSAEETSPTTEAASPADFPLSSP